MPGGRGKLTDIALSLNNAKHKKIAKAIKMSIDHGYIVNASMIDIGVAYQNCNHPKSLNDIWCHALEVHKVDWSY